MPELPEVEVTRRKIASSLIGRTIARVRTTGPSYFFLTPPARLSRCLKGRRVILLERLGKYLIAGLDDSSRLLLHLGMTGQLFVEGSSSLRLLSSTSRAALKPEQQRAFTPDGHTHLRLEFVDGGPEVWFRDVRKFGKIKWLSSGEVDVRLSKLGVDALSADGATLFAVAQRRSVAIKTVLLDQTVFAGVGNIYADEALFRSQIHPACPARLITRDQCRRLADEVRKVLRRAVATGGSSISDYVNPDGSDGAFQNERMVYAREGQPCKVCKTTIQRVVIGQRSSHFCPTCQRPHSEPRIRKQKSGRS